jgi:hypothetical protein
LLERFAADFIQVMPVEAAGLFFRFHFPACFVGMAFLQDGG